MRVYKRFGYQMNKIAQMNIAHTEINEMNRINNFAHLDHFTHVHHKMKKMKKIHFINFVTYLNDLPRHTVLVGVSVHT